MAKLTVLMISCHPFHPDEIKCTLSHADIYYYKWLNIKVTCLYSIRKVVGIHIGRCSNGLLRCGATSTVTKGKYALPQYPPIPLFIQLLSNPNDPLVWPRHKFNDWTILTIFIWSELDQHCLRYSGPPPPKWRRCAYCMVI